jgi:hypothetical protein
MDARRAGCEPGACLGRYPYRLYGETSSWASSPQVVNPFLMSPLYKGWIYAAAVAAPGDKSALVAALGKKRFAIAGWEEAVRDRRV